MKKHNPDNERIKRRYLTHLKQARQQTEASVDSAAEALARFEADTQYRDFRAFHIEQAIAFKGRLAHARNARSGSLLSKSTVYATLMHLKRFFQWLSEQAGYRSKLQYSNAEYFNPADKDARVATARREGVFPTLEQVCKVIAVMPAASDVERRNRALVAFTLLTGARDAAIASLKLKHVDITGGFVDQDARDVNTKNSKTFRTYFMPVSDGARRIVEDWVTFLRGEMGWDQDDPLFPSTRTVLDRNHQFEVAGLDRKHWRTADPIRAIFRAAFNAAGLPYFNPHSLRKTLATWAEEHCTSAEQFKAFSQNLGHDGVMTTFSSYGAVQVRRQGEIIRELANRRESSPSLAEEIAEAVAKKLGR